MVTTKYKNISETDYEKIRGPDWPSYDEFSNAITVPDFIIEELESMVADHTPVTVFAAEDAEYRTFLKKEYLYVVENRSIIELGPNYGFHTSLIQELCPRSHEVIETDPVCIDTLKNLYSDHVVITNDDVFLALQKNKKIDVMVCFGLLYHLHSPLYLLELIANNCDPDIVLLDCVNSSDMLEFIEETPNVPGNRGIVRQWKSANFNLVVPFEIVAQSMKQLGYGLKKVSNLQIKNYPSKSNSWVGMWEKLSRKKDLTDASKS